MAASLLASLVIAAACAGPATPKPPPSPSPPPTPACAATQNDVRALGVQSPDPVLLLAAGLNQPDDLLVEGDQVLVGELGPGEIARIGGDAPVGSFGTLPIRVPSVEGMAVAGGTLYVADQAGDRVLAVNGSQTSTLIQLRPVPGVEGVDGIAAQKDTLVVPDSPRGAVLFVDRSGRVLRAVGGFARPTGAWPLPDGALLVADENAGTVVRLAPDGSRTVLIGGLPLADDTAEDGHGNVYAISISEGSLVRAAAGHAASVATGLGQPQGLGVDSAGNLLVSEFTRGRLDAVVAAFKLQPPVAGGPALAPGQPLCVRLDRAPGFSAPVLIEAGDGYRVTQQPGVGAQGSVLPRAGCAGACRLAVTVRSGDRADTATLAYRG